MVKQQRADGRSVYYDRFRGRLMIPICDARGRVIAFGARVLETFEGHASPTAAQSGGPGAKRNTAKYLNSPESRLFKKRETVFGLHQARSEIERVNTMIVVEGYFDAIVLHSAGVKNGTCTKRSGAHALMVW